MKQVEKDARVIVDFLKEYPNRTIYEMAEQLDGISSRATHDVLHFIRNNTEKFEVALLENSGFYWITENVLELSDYCSNDSIKYMNTRTSTMVNMLDFFYRKTIPGSKEAKVLRRLLSLATAAEIFQEVGR